MKLVGSPEDQMWKERTRCARIEPGAESLGVGEVRRNSQRQRRSATKVRVKQREWFLEIQMIFIIMTLSY